MDRTRTFGLAGLVSAVAMATVMFGLGTWLDLANDGEWVELMGFHILGWFLLVFGSEFANRRYVRRSLVWAGPGCVVLAALVVAAIGLMPGADRTRPVIERVGAAQPVVVSAIIGLVLVGRITALIAILWAITARLKLIRGLRWLAAASGVTSVVIVADVERLILVNGMMDYELDGHWIGLGLTVPLALLSLALFGVAQLLRAAPDYGGAPEFPETRWTCPRCSRTQRRGGMAGCERCGLDVRIELR